MAQLRCAVLPSPPTSTSSPLQRRHPPGPSSKRVSMACVRHHLCFYTCSLSASEGKSSDASSPSSVSSSSRSSSSDLPSVPSPSLRASNVDDHASPQPTIGGGNSAGPFNGYGGGGGGGRSDGQGNKYGKGENPGPAGKGGLFGAFIKGWNDRVNSDPQFPFKVLMEQVVGVGACVIGDMASRPNFGLNELDFVFSTIVVGSILNFTLMYMLAPTSAAAAGSCLPLIFAGCPAGHMFEQGSYSLLDRFGTFVYKGALFAAVGFAAGLVGTFTSNFLISTRKRMDSSFETQNEAPPTLLNASTWAIHMGLSSNLRYQAVNGLEFAMANFLPVPVFKVAIFATRTLNNVLGGMSFVALARLTGSQKAESPKVSITQLTNTEQTIMQPRALETVERKDEDAGLAKKDDDSMSE